MFFGTQQKPSREDRRATLVRVVTIQIAVVMAMHESEVPLLKQWVSTQRSLSCRCRDLSERRQWLTELGQSFVRWRNSQ